MQRYGLHQLWQPDERVGMSSTQFAVLTDSRRRLLLSWLDESGEVSTTIETLAERVVEHEPEERLDAVLISLHHIHLPKMADNDLLEYDSENNRVRRSPEEHAEIPVSL